MFNDIFGRKLSFFYLFCFMVIENLTEISWWFLLLLIPAAFLNEYMADVALKRELQRSAGQSLK